MRIADACLDSYNQFTYFCTRSKKLLFYKGYANS